MALEFQLILILIEFQLLYCLTYRCCKMGFNVAKPELSITKLEAKDECDKKKFAC